MLGRHVLGRIYSVKMKEEIHKKIRCIIFIGIFNLIPFMLTAQQSEIIVTGTDTIILGTNKIMIINNLPSICYKNITSYEEGCFIDYTFRDSSVLTIHFGSMVSKPLYKDFLKDFELTDKSEIEQQFYSYQGYHVIQNKKRFFREMELTGIRITLIYFSVKQEDIYLYNKILDNIKIKSL